MTKEKLKTKGNTASYFNSRDISPLSNDIREQSGTWFENKSMITHELYTAKSNYQFIVSMKKCRIGKFNVMIHTFLIDLYLAKLNFNFLKSEDCSKYLKLTQEVIFILIGWYLASSWVLLAISYGYWLLSDLACLFTEGSKRGGPDHVSRTNLRKFTRHVLKWKKFKSLLCSRLQGNLEVSTKWKKRIPFPRIF